MSEQDYEQLTLFPVDSLASHSALLPGTDEARKMTATSGLKCCELLKNSGPLGYLVKMCLGSSVWHSTRCFLTWKPRVTKHNALLFQLAVSMPHTKENDAQFWPTVVRNGGICGGSGAIKTLKAMCRKGLITETELKNFQQGNGGKTNPELLEWLMGYEARFTSLIPTPTSSRRKSAASNRFLGGGSYKSNIDELLELTPLGKIGLMNPEWIEWLMGYPIGWTELDV